MISGLSAEVVAWDDYRLTATDEYGDTVTLTFTLDVASEGHVRDLGLALAGDGTAELTLILEGEHTKQTGQAATHGITLRLDWQS